MNQEHLLQEKHIKKTIKLTGILSFIISAATVLSFIYGFYYKSLDTQQEHTETINELKVDVKEIKTKLNSTDVENATNRAEMKAAMDKLNVMEKKMDRVDDKLDKILIKMQ